MHLPFPERLSLYHATIFCIVLYVLQQINGTSFLFSICSTLFVLVVTVAFNVAGGLTRPSGSFIFSWALLAALFGISYKAILGEPGQSNLLQPNRTIEVYVGTAVAMLIAAYLARRFTPKKVLFPQFSSDVDMARASIACLFLGGAVQIYLTFAVTSRLTAGGLTSAFAQLNYFVPLAMIFGVISEIRKSGGKRSVNITVWIAAFLIFAGGVLGYSKEGMFTPFVCWIFPAASQRYKVSITQVAGVILAFGLTTSYLVPYSQFGRNFRVDGASFSENFKTNVYLLSNLDKIRAASRLEAERYNEYDNVVRYYSHPEVLIDRLQMISPDDALVNAVENGGAYGIFPTIFYFENVIPHFLWPGKPVIDFGNIYAHEVGILTDNADTTTGISFSPAGEAYYQARWVGTFVLLPLLLVVMFLVVDLAYGDTRHSPFALLALVSFLHEAPERGISGIVRGMTFEFAALFVVSLVCVKLMPIIADLIVPPAKQRPRESSVILQRHDRAVIDENIPDILPMEVAATVYRWSGRAPRT